MIVIAFPVRVTRIDAEVSEPLKHPSDKGGGAVILVSTKRGETGVTALFLD